MTLFIIAAAFIALTFVVLYLAMRSGPAKRANPDSGNAGFALLMVLILAFGLGVPAYAVVNNSDDGSKDAISGVQLSSAEVEGREQFRVNCSICHALADAGAAGLVGPNLDQLRPPADLTLNAIELGRARGMGQMPSQLLDGPDAKNVANYIAKVAGR